VAVETAVLGGCRSETQLRNHYCDSRRSAWRDPPGTAVSCSISFIPGVSSGDGVSTVVLGSTTDYAPR